MKAYYLGAAGGKPKLELREVPKPEPKAGEILVRVRAASLNRGELILGHGLMHAGSDAPAKPFGLDGAGEVDGHGPETIGWKKGSRVMGRLFHGFGEYALASAREAMPVPEPLSWEEAAAIPIAFLTAYDMLVSNGGLKEGEWVLVTGVSSGVGVASLQLAKALGAKVIGTSGSADKLAALKKVGLDHGLVARGGLSADEVKRLTGGRGVDIVINNVGGTMFEACIAALAYRGRLATVGYVDGVTTARIDLGALHAQRLTLFGVSNKNRTVAEREASIAGFVRDVLPHFASGRIRPVIDKVYPFEEMPAAQARMLADAQVGKIVLKMM